MWKQKLVFIDGGGLSFQVQQIPLVKEQYVTHMNMKWVTDNFKLIKIEISVPLDFLENDLSVQPLSKPHQIINIHTRKKNTMKRNIVDQVPVKQNLIISKSLPLYIKKRNWVTKCLLDGMIIKN